MRCRRGRHAIAFQPAHTRDSGGSHCPAEWDSLRSSAARSDAARSDGLAAGGSWCGWRRRRRMLRPALVLAMCVALLAARRPPLHCCGGRLCGHARWRPPPQAAARTGPWSPWCSRGPRGLTHAGLATRSAAGVAAPTCLPPATEEVGRAEDEASAWDRVLTVAGDGMYPDLDRRRVAVLAMGERWAVVYNPAGVAAHKDSRWKSEGMRNPMTARLQRTFGGRQTHLVHRLDRGTSGMSLVAFDPAACTALAQALTGPNSTKVYYALCRASIQEWQGRGPMLIERPLRDKFHTNKARRQQLKAACTEMEVLWGGGPPRCVFVRAMPRTGRYHQIRRHLRNLSMPVLGDHWGRKATRGEWEAHGMPLPDRVMLHLHRLVLPATPLTPAINVSCPLPPGFNQALRCACPTWYSEAAAALPELFAPPPADLLADEARAHVPSTPGEDNGESAGA